MDDRDVLGRINELVEEEHRLERQAQGTGLDEAARERLGALEVQLDQCWDLMRQRRARREFGENPDEAHVRASDTVERYLQ
ncbi:MAG TPA: DUF2630 family protein [Actinomycetota bacterium]|nr:DUF2630 family protein [Actinomycetota bacterium]